MEKNQYTITTNATAKTMCVIAGHLTEQAAIKLFIEEFTRKAKAIPAADYTLEIDTREMKVVTPELAKSLGDALLLYKEAGFHTIRIITDNNALLNMQYKRLARNAGLSNVEFM